jgi:hypothetical protein
MEINPLERLGAGTRVAYVVRALHKDAKRGEQACLVDDLRRDRFPLDVDYYVGAIRKKVDPIISALFVAEERARMTHVAMDGRIAVVEHARACDRDTLPGQVEAARCELFSKTYQTGPSVCLPCSPRHFSAAPCSCAFGTPARTEYIWHRYIYMTPGSAVRHAHDETRLTWLHDAPPFAPLHVRAHGGRAAARQCRASCWHQ